MKDINTGLVGIRNLLKKESLADERLFDGLAKPDLFLATLTLISGKFGRYDYRRLKRAAAAIEFLNVGVGRHYKVTPVIKKQSSKGSAELGLITGDYYYAKAIVLILPLGQEVVRVGARAIADVAQGEIDEARSRTHWDVDTFRDKMRQRSALYAASFQLGCLLSGIGPQLSQKLSRFGECLGAVALLTEPVHVTEEQRIEVLNSFLTESSGIFASLPRGEGFDCLKEATAQRYSHLS